jgi:ATP-dependent Clp protease ATP-binding subunit ClpC
MANIPLVKQAEKVLKMTYLEAKLFKSPMIGTEHLLSILKDEDSVACKVLNKYGVIYENVKDELEAMIDENTSPRAEFPGGQEEESGIFAPQSKPTIQNQKLLF